MKAITLNNYFLLLQLFPIVPTSWTGTGSEICSVTTRLTLRSATTMEATVAWLRRTLTTVMFANACNDKIVCVPLICSVYCMYM